MVDLVDEQRTLAQRISRVAINLKKKGKANITLGMLRAAHSSIQEFWADFSQGDLKIRKAARNDAKLRDSAYIAEDEFSDVHTTYLEQAGVLLDMIAEFETAAAVKVPSDSNVTPGEATFQRSRAVLPKMALPTFEGHYKDWPSFRDLFTSLIINDSSLSPVECLHYLKTCMKGEAMALLKNIRTTNDNFNIAWNKLEDRFNNPRLLVQAQIRALSSVAPLRKESAAEMKRLFNETFDAIDALENLGRPVTNAVDWIVELTVERWDRQSRREWEDSLKHSKDHPTLEQLRTFMEGRIQTCEALEPQTDEASDGRKVNVKSAKVHTVSKASSSAKVCALCQGNHFVLYCGRYQAKTAAERKETAKTLNLCFNCLGKHPASECTSSKRCQKCEGKHHTTIHEAAPSTKSTKSPEAFVQHVSMHVSRSSFSVLLSTARVAVSGPRGQGCSARSLIDPGSEVSLITEALAQRLGVKRSQARVPLLGVGGARAKFTRGKTTLVISPPGRGELRFQIPVYILPELSRYRPYNLPARVDWPHIRGLELADPGYHLADPVDIPIGADSYNIILREGVRRGPPHTPVAQETALGWILTGGIDSGNADGSSSRAEVPVHHCNIDRELIEFLTRFWEQEEVETSIPATADDRKAEKHFLDTHQRLPDGRFMVRLPFARTPELGDSRLIALRTLDSLSSRFQRSAEFRQAYGEFLATYEALGHMAATTHPISRAGYYLPHHGVMRESSTTTKLRVVFNGSKASSNGKSLNEFLLRGPNLLPNLADILLRWRRYALVFTADIEKMYRQIIVHPDDRKWQRILWRPAGKSSVVDYDLNTVTYGLTSAPYLAIRCLHQLAKVEAQRFPLGSGILLEEVYMDDVLTGADTPSEAKAKQRELRELLMAGGFPLRKWAANAPGLLEGLSRDERKGIVEWDSPTLHSVLGIKWLPSSDCFQVSAVKSLPSSGFTKRAVLSGTAQLFDPLGWLAPVTIVAKVLIQSLWLLKVDWDTPLPEKEEKLWRQFQNGIPELQHLQVPRWLGTSSCSSPPELHGFADASERAYAAVVYSRSVNPEGVATVSLIVAKSKVAPLKRVSLPRLELCAAFLLTRLVEHVVRVLDWPSVDVHLWSDSAVALSWIRGHPTRWPTYVANRVAEIQRMLPAAKWHHIRSAENPADCASRGLSPAELPKFSLWWRGPEWLASPGPLPEETRSEATHEVEEHQVLHVTSREKSSSSELVERFSSLNRLLRVLAWCRRWVPGNRQGESLITAAEIRTSKLTLLRLEQAAAFAEDIANLRKGRPLAARSRLAKLCPILDKDGVLRVGGRIQAANLPYDRTHPAILPDESSLARLWVDAAHKRCLHGETQLTLATLRQECWILKGRHLVKACIHRCTTCIRWKGQTAPPKMGNLPLSRITPSRPFFRSGIDYAGPIHVRTSRGRGKLTSKGYIAVFICLATRAVQLEAVSDGSTETFLAALRRFISRRGRCAELHSDCGRNFIGANHELRTLLKQSVAQGGGPFAAASREGITWKFNPPSAPHFGGIWEAAVKSVKHHLRRLIGEQRLSFEELATLLTGIEACLNSRPILPLSDDPEDPAALTPGHFLVGEPLLAIPEPSLEELSVSRLSRWQLVQQMQQHFWRRWSREYLNSLQPRGKWRRDQAWVKAGSLCLVKNEILPPTQWPLARVVHVHPGPDGSTRVVTLRTSTSQLLRPVHKLIPLLAPEIDETGHGNNLEAGLSA
ncbi:uncharacterized protein LOC143363629 [Halictus rubicundus]|uniref:uncharacterized protein LOC143363629 n=1 Tax=Halictus rubicundus TaxID=77578 RepID=UPI0040362B54